MGLKSFGISIPAIITFILLILICITMWSKDQGDTNPIRWNLVPYAAIFTAFISIFASYYSCNMCRDTVKFSN